MENMQGAGLDEMLKAGVQAVKAGNPDTARMIFKKVLERDRRNERALFWMASVVETVEEKQRYLRATLKVNPDNKQAKRYLRKLEQATSERDNRLVTYAILGIIGLIVLGGLFLGAVFILSGGL